MPNIRCLDPHVADLIAAGEVVERPASVVKELTENAIDAGATSVTVEIQRGGMSYIRVTDNGCGIAPDEVETAFLRHATSKIRDEYDLEAIGTLGFRGEALAAIAAVSRVEIMTRQKQADFGMAVVLDGGIVREKQEAGCPAGTTMIVRDLFYNTPARLKFVKRDASEGAAVYAVVQHAALSHPEVSFRFLREGKEEMTTSGDGKLKSALYSVLGRDLALGLIPCKSAGEDITVAGYVTLPTCCRGTRGYQHFFVNGRYVKSRTMASALEEAYKNEKMVGKFPGCVLHIQTKLNAVDVNVHPTKTEVKFTSEKKLFDAVYFAVKGALERESGHPAVKLETERKPVPKQDTVTPNQTFFRTMTAEEFRKAPPKAEPNKPANLLRSTARAVYETKPAQAPKPVPAQKETPKSAEPTVHVMPAYHEEGILIGGKNSAFPPEKRRVSPLEQKLREKSTPKRAPVPAEAPKPAPAPNPEPAPAEVTPDTPAWRIAGEVLNTYIIVEQGDSVFLIDKHAAHERMNFDRLKAQDYEPMSQLLLKPMVLRMEPDEGDAILRHLELLRRFGFEVEDFGGGDLLVRQVPDYLNQGDIEPTLNELAETLRTNGTADPTGVRDEVLHTMACKSAIKGGWKNEREELEAVARAVMSGQVKYCPHGRPVAIEMTKNQLERQFKRA